MTPAERKILDRQDQAQVICEKCGATLADYRRGEKCEAPLHVACLGFMWVEHALRGVTPAYDDKV